MHTTQTADFLVYMYTINNDSEVIYVGQTQRGLYQRIKEHAAEPRFKDALRNERATIRYMTLSSKDDMDVCERGLIKTFNPVLNRKGLSDSSSFPKMQINIKNLPIFTTDKAPKGEKRPYSVRPEPTDIMPDFTRFCLSKAEYSEPKSRVLWAVHQFCCFIGAKTPVKDEILNYLQTMGYQVGDHYVSGCMLHNTFNRQNNHLTPEADNRKISAWIDIFVKRASTWYSAYKLKHDIEEDIGIYMPKEQMVSLLRQKGFTEKDGAFKLKCLRPLQMVKEQRSYRNKFPFIDREYWK